MPVVFALLALVVVIGVLVLKRQGRFEDCPIDGCDGKLFRTSCGHACSRCDFTRWSE